MSVLFHLVNVDIGSLVVDDKDTELGLASQSLPLLFILDLFQLSVNITLKFSDSVLEGGSSIVDLVDYQDFSTEQTSMVQVCSELHINMDHNPIRVTYSGEIEPLCSSNFGTDLFCDLRGQSASK